jgi:SAM-dependent MidA family methyltransferase
MVIEIGDAASTSYNSRMSWIVEEITARGGAVSFRDFMELALYHPDRGYYSATSPRYGRRGDFITAPTASSWYARAIVRLLRAIAKECGPLTLVDVGSGDGGFLDGVARELGTEPTEVVGRLASVERSESMRRRQRDQFVARAVPHLHAADIHELALPPRGCVIHASELYDALPVHRLVAGERGIFELWVAVERDQLRWREYPAREELDEYFRDYGLVLEPGQLAEVNLDAAEMHRDLIQLAGESGMALVLDYGHPAARLYDPRARRGGSLACYRAHRVGRDPFESPGSQDITAHVNWDDLRSVASRAGWREIGLWQLAEFMVLAGIGDLMEDAGMGADAELTVEVVAQRQEVKRLLDPDGMGSDLKMLVQASGPMAEVAAVALAVDAA